MERHCSNAMAVARFLDKHPRVEKVIYPGLRAIPSMSWPSARCMASAAWSRRSSRGSLEDARRFLERCEIFALAESLGGVESLIEHPAIMTHASLPPEVRASLGIGDGLVRLSVGVEDEVDLLEELQAALG
jgi:Cystathionine beta-lyases/cystathionine gamma-synthases